MLYIKCKFIPENSKIFTCYMFHGFLYYVIVIMFNVCYPFTSPCLHSCVDVNSLLDVHIPSDLTSIPIGASIELKFRFSIVDSNSNYQALVPLNHTPLQVPTINSINEEMDIRVSYSHASPSLTGEYILCRGMIGNSIGNSRKKRVVFNTDQPMDTLECGERISISVYGKVLG